MKDRRIQSAYVIIGFFFIAVVLYRWIAHLGWAQGIAPVNPQSGIEMDWWLTILRFVAVLWMGILLILLFKPLQGGVITGELAFPGIKKIPLGLLVLAIVILPFWVYALFSHLFNLPTSIREMMDFFYQHPAAVSDPMWLLIDASLTIFLVPIVEEFVFRGACFNVLLLHFNKIGMAIVGSTLFFTLAHVPWFSDITWQTGVSMGVVSLHGLILGGLRHFSGSLYPGLVYHMGWNAWIYFGNIV